MEIILSVCAGIGLSAAVGLRIFLPPFLMSLAAVTGYFVPAPGFEWIGTLPATLLFGVATLLEITGYYIPWLDNLLDAIAIPAAVIAGIAVAASSIVGLDPLLRWVVAVVAGGGAAGAVQWGTALARMFSTGTTGGLGNPLLATGEAISSFVVSTLSIVAPIVAVVVVTILGILIHRRVGRHQVARRTR